MARSSRVDFGMSGIKRHASRLGAAEKRADTIARRAAATLQRRLKPEAARLIASEVLNLSPAKVRRHLDVGRVQTKTQDIIVVSASRVRLPLQDYTPRVSRLTGATVTTWRATGPRRYPHAFRRKDARGIWQRIPERKGAAQLVQRLPIVQLKGPSLHRVFWNRGRYATRTDITGPLTNFVELTVSREIARLIRST